MKATKRTNKRRTTRGPPSRSVINSIPDPRPYPVALANLGSPSPAAMPASYHCYMTLAWDYGQNTANPGFYNLPIKLNSLFQPIGGAGEYGYGDELSALYGKWRVLSSTIVIEACHPNSTVVDDIVLYPTVLAADAATSCQGARERWKARSDVLTGGNKTSITLRSSITMADLVGGSWRDDDYAATGAADPSHVCYWNVASAPRSAAQAAITLNGRITAELLFTELKPSTSA